MPSPYSRLEKRQRIFVNRSLNMARIRAIGFDMDHTLVRYNREAFESLAFRATLDKLIASGYPEELSVLEFKPKFVIRGLLVDMDRGNLLKVDGRKYVKIAFHGFTELDHETRHRLYNNASFRANEFLSVDTFFALSEVQLFTEIVDYMAKNPGKITKSFREIYGDLRTFIDLSHQDGTIKRAVVREPERFINKDKFLANALVRYIDGAKILFLLTNSGWEYTNQMMEYILSGENSDFSNWRDYFQLVIVGAGKPGFFNGSQPFYEVMTDSSLLRITSGDLVRGHVYHGGNAKLFQKLSKIGGDEILYVGDHIYGDIMQSKDQLNWRTALVVEELDNELPKLAEIGDLFAKVQQTMNDREALDEELQILRSKIASMERQIRVAGTHGENKKAYYMEKELERLLEKSANKEAALADFELEIKSQLAQKEAYMHPTWGELMKVGLERSRFAYQVEGFACIYTSRVSNFRFYSPFKNFRSFHNMLPHDI